MWGFEAIEMTQEDQEVVFFCSFNSSWLCKTFYLCKILYFENG